MDTRRIHELRQKIEDPTYMNLAIQDMASKLSLELFPRIYDEQAALRERDQNSEEDFRIKF